MIYTKQTNKALNLCYEAHAGQFDKSGVPYVFHPFHVAEQMDDEKSVIVALLHDVVEDTDKTLDDLREAGFDDAVIEAVDLLTHDKAVPYMDYVRAIKKNPLATKVKLADLRHNMDSSRMVADPTKEDEARLEKYKHAEQILLSEAAETGNKSEDKPESKLEDAVFGLAIADALGVPYEFKMRDTFQCTKMTGYGTHHQPAGTWSDDTSMTIATAKSIKDNDGAINIEDIRNNFLDWVNNDAFTADGEVFDIGNATRDALYSGEPRTDDRSNGNGSLMRILPLAFTDCTDDEIRAVSAITHGHETSMRACVIYVHVARRLLNGETIAEIIPTLQSKKPFDRLYKLYQLSIDEIKSSGYVVDTLEAALWCLAKNQNFKDTVLAAVNLGDDTDTVGAVAGGLAGIIYGLQEDFAKDCMETLRNKELIRECI